MAILAACWRRPFLAPSRLDAIRLRKLRRLVAHARNRVTFHSKRLSGIREDAIRTLEDLRELPLTTPDELRSEPLENLMPAGSLTAGRLVLYATSGTSGRPFRFWLSNDDVLKRQIHAMRMLWLHGARPWWRGVELLKVRGRPKEGMLQRLIRSRMRDVSIDDPPGDQVRTLEALRPHLLDAMPPSLEVLCDWMLEHGVRYRGARLLTTGGGAVSPGLGRKIREAFGLETIDVYGTAETGPMGFRCPRCRFNCFQDDSHIVEILDRHNGPAGPGQQGRVVVTALDQFTMPVLRYDVGDLVSLPPSGEDCAVGFGHYASVDGRQVDVVTLADGRQMHLQHINPIYYELEGRVRQFQLLQRAEGTVVFRYVPGEGADPVAIEAEVARLMNFGPGSGVRFEACREVPRDAGGKFRPVRNEGRRDGSLSPSGSAC